ncbi:MAG: hypothetical protein JXA81_01440 [Sedimentisphaerales bacterium]|nr:hypothetical protein [Sedimentisphaerales bacterium]
MIYEKELLNLVPLYGDLPESISGTTSVSSPKTNAMHDALTLIEDGSKPLLELPWRKARRIFLDRLEREYLRRLLESTKGHIGQTAKMADIQPRSIFDKMKNTVCVRRISEYKWLTDGF